jgi:hypothetical protein
MQSIGDRVYLLIIVINVFFDLTINDFNREGSQKFLLVKVLSKKI